MHFPKDRTAHTTAFYGPVVVVDHWLEEKIAQTENAFAMEDRSGLQEDPNLYSGVLYCLRSTFIRLFIYLFTMVSVCECV